MPVLPRPRPLPVRAALVAIASSLAWAYAAAAASGEPFSGSAPPQPPDPPAWSEGPARAFLGGRFDLGDVEQLEIAAGYGKPHWTWAGAVARELCTWSFCSGAVGVRVALRAVNLSASWRATRSFTRIALAPAESHVALAEGGGITLRGADLSLSGGLPAPGGFALWETSWTRYVDAPPAVHIYDEILRAIVDPRWAGAVRAGYVARLRGGDGSSGPGALDAGALAEWIALPGRRGAPLVRAGPVLSWRATRHLEVNGSATFTLSSPDRLDFWREFCAVGAVGYLFATGDASPGFP